MTSILNFEPVLSHIGAIDINNAAGTMYHILYNGDITTLGNILMFEYKLIDANANIIPSNITTGFVAMENATNTGITNQWSIAIPGEDDAYNPSTPKTIQVRVYVGLTGSVKVGITKWSNELKVHNPPPKPLIASAYYNANSYGSNFDDLFIFLTKDDAIDYDEVRFVVAYYYTDNSDNTVWDVSGLLTADAISSNDQRRMITISDFGVVNDSWPKQYVYVSVYAVYPFTIINETFYAVSQVSAPYDAPAAAAHAAPIIYSTTYKIYDTITSARSQVMNVGWAPPPNADVPSFVVSKYHIEKSTDNEIWTLITDTIDSTTLDFDADVSQYQCDETVYFRVTSRSVMNTVSASSSLNDYSHLEIFKYANAPSGLTIANISGASGSVNMTVNFNTPTDTGCGAPIEFNIDIDDVNVETVIHNGSGSYSVALSNLDVTASGTVTVYLVTSDTNPIVPGTVTNYSNRNGASVSTTYVVVSDLVMAPVDYDVYDSVSQQNMNLSWSSTIPSGWSGTYIVYKTINDDDVTRETLDTVNTVGQSPTHTYDSSNNNCDEILGFYVILSITDGDETYETRSNTANIEIFKYADAPYGLTIENISGAANNVTMTVNFNAPTDTGCGTPSAFNIVIGGSIVGTVNYNGSGSYSETLSNLDVLASETVTVYLVTSDTNPTVPGGSIYDDLNGASVSTTYVVVSDLVMAPVDYDVYDSVSQQNMNLSWSSTIPSGWSGTYIVYKTINDDDVTRETLDTVNTVGQSPTHTYDSSNNNCDEILGFYVILSITDGDETYETRSNTANIEIFKYAGAPEAVNVLWASGTIDETGDGETFASMDLKMSFKNSPNPGCGQIYKYKVDVCSTDGTELATQEITHVADTSTPTIYQVSFDNIALQGYTTGKVKVYLKTTDTNSSGILSGSTAEGPWTVDSLPIFIDVVMDTGRNNLSFSVISHTPLSLNGQLIGTTTKNFKLSVTSQSAGTTVIINPNIINGTYKYDVTIASSFMALTSFTSNLIVAVSNAIGTNSISNI